MVAMDPGATRSSGPVVPDRGARADDDDDDGRSSLCEDTDREHLSARASNEAPVIRRRLRLPDNEPVLATRVE